MLPLQVGLFGPGFAIQLFELGNHIAEVERAVPEVIKLEFILKHRIKRNDCFFAYTCPQPIIALYF